MTSINKYDVIIIGGSYSGLSAAMALGRAIRQVIIIDGGKPCNRQTPHSHNFLTQDGKSPGEITELAKAQVTRYDTVSLYEGRATGVTKIEGGFQVETESGSQFQARKLIFATGLKDTMPPIPGFAECWGISILHCPYCHGYEVRNQPTAIIGNGDIGFEFAKVISNWSGDLTLFTNGSSTLSPEQRQKLASRNIGVVETRIISLEHSKGVIENIVLEDSSGVSVKAVYARPAFVQHCDIPEKSGCEITPQGLLKVDLFQKTTVPGIFACGDNASPLRALSACVAAGTMAGAAANKELIEDGFF